MKLKIVFAFILIFQTIGIQANNWQQQYMADEFGDADYSRPVYELMVTPPKVDMVRLLRSTIFKGFLS